jgi:Second Longin domain of FUZ, MON1 and HPS1
MNNETQTKTSEKMCSTANEHIIVMSDSGKPLYSTLIPRNNDRDDSVNNNVDDDNIVVATSTICSIVQSIQTSSRYNVQTIGDFGNLQSIRLDNLFLVFMTVVVTTPTLQEHQQEQSITLIAIRITDATTTTRTITSTNHDYTTTESYLRIRLEYIYAQLVLTLTDHLGCMNFIDIERVLVQNRDCCCCHCIGTSRSTGRSSGNFSCYCNQIHPASIFTGGIQVLYPISYSVRHHTSYMIQQHLQQQHLRKDGTSVGDTVTLAALLFIGQQYITIVQSSSSYPLRSSDLLLIPTLINRQFNHGHHHRHTEEELWIPLCLPRLHSSRYVHCYATCLASIQTNVVLCLISTMGTTEQFQQFRTVSHSIRQSLVSSSMKNDPSSIAATTKGNDDDDEDEEEYEVITALDALPMDDKPHNKSLMSEITNAMSVDQSSRCCESHLYPKEWARKYLIDDMDGTIRHFVFRVTIPIVSTGSGDRSHEARNRNSVHASTSEKMDGKRNDNEPAPRHDNDTSNHLIQCIASSLDPFVTDINNESPSLQQQQQQQEEEHRLWNMYHKLHLRLRIGSSNTESIHHTTMYRPIDASATNTTNVASKRTSTTKSLRNKKQPVFPSIDIDCPTIVFSESTPTMEGIAYITEDSTTYYAMNGHGFELYVFDCIDRVELD